MQSIVNLDSDDSGHDEPKIPKLEENKQGKDTSSEENCESSSAGQENPNPSGAESKEQTEIKKISPPSKRDIAVRKLKHQLK
jgi:hypothetical protein